MRKIKLAFLVLVAVGASLTLSPAKASAQGVNDFTITNFAGDYTLSQNDPQGALDIKEQITVDFTAQNHGILRALPENYNGQPLKIHVKTVDMNGQSEQYTTSTQNGNLVLKIGDPNQTVTGNQSYEIDYSVVNVMRFTSDHDELDWNINGDQWSEPFDHVSATLHVPASLASQIHNTACYTGYYGATTSNCTISQPANHTTVTFVANQTLQANTTLTIRADFTKGTFTAPTFKDWLGDHGAQVAEVLAPPILALIIFGGWWWTKGRDLKGRGTIIPEYGPPAW